ncbi:cyclin-dependent kinases regulatory subunit isoform X2 [Camponotus floridanus]|uniref:cyclin-dependent kinases regulatory subunit isoform X2 n=1 Tax=Camponotus floridanus TaxID=104421 RepID=UPI000DC69492|nr:cyclin-dependent kinases regulatory subunit isoform X2 [Camponotus floridanus]
MSDLWIKKRIIYFGSRIESKEHLGFKIRFRLIQTEWRNLGVQQSPGWVHYMMHGPEPHVLLFRRLRTDLLPSRCTASQREQTVVQCN